MAMLSALFWLLALPVLPIFSLVVIGIDVLLVHGRCTHSEAVERS